MRWLIGGREDSIYLDIWITDRGDPTSLKTEKPFILYLWIT